MARLLLASRGIPDLVTILGARGHHAILIPDAADPLDDPTIPAEVEGELGRAGLEVHRLALATSTSPQTHSAVTAADVVAVSGGDPSTYWSSRDVSGSVTPYRQRLTPVPCTSATAPGRCWPRRLSSRSR